AYAASGEKPGKPLSLIALEDQGVAFDCAAAAEGRLQIIEPQRELAHGEVELLDGGDLLAATPFALHAHDCARRPFRRRRWGGGGGRGKIGERFAERAAGVGGGLLFVAHGSAG